MDRHESTKKELIINDKFQRLERQRKQIDDQLAINKQKMDRIEKLEKIFTTIILKQKNQLEDLSSSWKGQHARNVLSETARNYQDFSRCQQHEIYENKRELRQDNRNLQINQEKLVQEKRLIMRGEK